MCYRGAFWVFMVVAREFVPEFVLFSSALLVAMALAIHSQQRTPKSKLGKPSCLALPPDWATPDTRLDGQAGSCAEVVLRQRRISYSGRKDTGPDPNTKSDLEWALR